MCSIVQLFKNKQTPRSLFIRICSKHFFVKLILSVIFSVDCRKTEAHLLHPLCWIPLLTSEDRISVLRPVLDRNDLSHAVKTEVLVLPFVLYLSETQTLEEQQQVSLPGEKQDLVSLSGYVHATAASHVALPERK